MCFVNWKKDPVQRTELLQASDTRRGSRQTWSEVIRGNMLDFTEMENLSLIGMSEVVQI